MREIAERQKNAPGGWGKSLRSAITLANAQGPISQKGTHLKLGHNTKTIRIIFPNHGSQEMGKGLEKRILKEAGIK